ncbi:MAG TPA: glutamine synthetase family protein [Acetobacteraceae bacterium]|nr:glutamine synthetase family protein [Acetobacteraceae bacterium]
MDNPLHEATEAIGPTRGGAVLEAFVVDVNGIARGKWVPAERIPDVMRKGVALPRSVYALDVWGRDVEAAGLAIGTGDPDGICMPVEGTLVPVTWLTRPTQQLLLNMVQQDGTPFYGDPRQVLARVAGFFAEAGLTPVVATELEFYFIDRRRTARDPVSPPFSNEGRWQGWQTQVLSIAELHTFEPVLADIFDACERQNVPADTAVRENGPGQYEVNLKHVADPVAAADHAFLLKRIVKGVARKHGWDATFMAKPYGHLAGSGMHVHMSVLDQTGRNIMAEENGAPTDRLRHAVGGMMATMADSMLLLAPHANSYRRLCPGTHAPTNITWGLDNRTAAIRVITSGTNTRVEHRVAGADCNPYLALAGILAGLLHGLKERIDPGPPITGEERQGHATLPFNWDDAIDAFDASAVMGEYLGAAYQDLFSAVKAQEQDEFRKRVTDVEYDAYLSSV